MYCKNLKVSVNYLQFRRIKYVCIIQCFDNICVFLLTGKDCAQPLPPNFTPPSYTSVCDVITAKDGPLADCVGRVDSKQYHDDCIYDMVLRDGKQEAACDIISDYVEECQRKAGCVKSWRTRHFCCKCSVVCVSEGFSRPPCHRLFLDWNYTVSCPKETTLNSRKLPKYGILVV